MLRSTLLLATSPPKYIRGKDKRVRVDPETSPPYNWICSLVITETNSKDHWNGSGFKIHLPNMNYCIVVTSGHCVYMNGAYADNITVTFPGQAAVTATQADLYAPPEYRNDYDRDYDYGIIILPGNSDEGFGWSAIIPDNELSGRIVTNCGYSGDKKNPHAWPQMWITGGGEITDVTTTRLFYLNDTATGQSGSPVYTWHNGYWTVVGVHSHGGHPNSAPRVTSQMIHRFLERTQNLKKYAVQSLAFPNVYIRCDGRGISSVESDGSGTINCQYDPPGLWEKFYIYPVEVTPSLAEEQTCIVVIQSCEWPIFFRLDGSDMTDTMEPRGGGVVNCQWNGIPAESQESFFLKKDKNGRFSFRSVAFPNCYIRLDGTGITSPMLYIGGGRINCQYYDTGKEPGTWELFYLEEQSREHEVK